MKKIILISYILFLLCFTVFSYLFIDPGLFYLKPLFTNFFQLHREVTTSLFIISIFLFFEFYGWMLQKIKQGTLHKRTVFKLIIATALILLFAYPAMISFDIFNYIATAKVTFFYHENPYILMPIEFTHDPLLLFMHAANKTALYAPFWIFLSGIPYVLGFGNFLLILFNFKLLSALFYVAIVFLLWKMTKDVFKTAFFALNPLVLIELLVSSHNESVMLFLLLLAIYLVQNKQNMKGSVLFILSVLIKYVTIILAPLFLVQIFKPLSKEKFFFWTTLCMYIIFFLSSFREEIYPWYTLWFFLPSIFLLRNSLFSWTATSFTFSMLLRYIPFMLLGTYFGPTPILKILLMVVPPVIAIATYYLTQKNKHLV